MSVFLTVLFFILVGIADVYCHKKIIESRLYWKLNVDLRNSMAIPFIGSIYVYICLKRLGIL